MSAKSLEINERLKQKCVEGIKLINKNNLNSESFNDIKAKLEYVINSYEHDKNPVGLFEVGQKAVNLLTDYKEKNPRKLNKRVITGWSKALSNYKT